MFTFRKAAQLTSPVISSRQSLGVASLRKASSLPSSILQTTTPTSERLKATEVWSYGRSSAELKGYQPAVRGDRARINIANGKLCDDILAYLGPSLQRHQGCDLLDLYPGAGVWSRKLHDAIQPRSHVLMEPDAELYKPFLEPLLSNPGVSIVQKSGIVWKDLNDVLQGLSHQVAKEQDVVPTRNDTLLVTMNLGTYPKRRYRKFSPVALLVLYQLLSTIRSRTLLQRYGHVRMLLWVNDETKNVFLPRNVARRRASALAAELSCDWVTEVAGLDAGADSMVLPPSSRALHLTRDRWIDQQSGRETMRRMAAAGLRMPKGRETQLVRELQASSATVSQPGPANAKSLWLGRPWLKKLYAMEAAYAAGEFSDTDPKFKKLYRLQTRARQTELDTIEQFQLLSTLDEMTALHEAGPASAEAFQQLNQRWNDDVRRQNANFHSELFLARDNKHVFNQAPPVMLWDQRSMEPLAVQPTEFFPNVECCLLDIQPKTMHPLLTQSGPQSSRSGDIFEIIQGAMLQHSLQPVSRSLESLWPGAAEGIIPACPSLTEASLGGRPGTDFAEVSPRTLNQRQWIEILDAWMKWPFRPTYGELVARLSEDGSETELARQGISG